MNKQIDKFALWGIITIAVFLFFDYAWKNIWLALVLTAVFVALLRLIGKYLANRYLSKGSQKKERRRRAEKRVSDWFYASPEQALSEAERVVLDAYAIQSTPDSEHRIVYDGKLMQFVLLSKHPDGLRADATQIADLWKAHQDVDALVLLNTGGYDEKALQFSKGLSTPQVVTLDARQLADLVLKSDCALPPEKSSHQTVPAKKAQRFSAFFRIATQKSALRNALYGALLLVLYLIIGIETYLIASLFLIALSVIGWRKPMVPSKLI